ncbi:MAG: class I SAM-dependent methyltransferase [Candidatus Sulfotelmatobacter sp.]|jgi:2-polyprenyl-3-methyl-5-hydroxy-6-metoxy-1,4-benzoquinol methylase
MGTDIGQIKAFFTDSDWYLQKRRYNIAIRAETVQEFLKTNHFDSILDIGCGDGSLSLPLLNSGRRLTLLDISSKMLSIAQSRVPTKLQKNVETVNDEFMRAKLENNSYDLVICVGVLAFVQSLDDFISRITSLLKPTGAVIMENTDASHFYTSMVRFYHGLRSAFVPDKCPTNTYSREAVLRHFRKRGFVLSGFYRYTLAFPLLQRMLSQEQLYKGIRRHYGTAERNRNAWMGNECLYFFQRSTAPTTKGSLPRATLTGSLNERRLDDGR